MISFMKTTMPIYTVEYLKGKNKGVTEDITCSYDDLQELKKSGKLKLIPTMPKIVSGRGTLTGGIDSGFNDVLKTIKKNNRGSNIETK